MGFKAEGLGNLLYLVQANPEVGILQSGHGAESDIGIAGQAGDVDLSVMNEHQLFDRDPQLAFYVGCWSGSHVINDKTIGVY